MSINIFQIFIFGFIACQLNSTKVARHDSSKVINGPKGYTKFEIGDINILISVPHEGSLAPADISDRTTDPLGNLVSDKNTRLIATTLRDELIKLFQVNNKGEIQPFMVYNNLLRRKMDPNRNSSECCNNFNEDSGFAYKSYHGSIEKYFCKSFMLNSPYKQGLLLDIHGQAHPENWIEIGYLLSVGDLKKHVLNQKLARKSSMYKLSTMTSLSFDELIRGKDSLGAILTKSNFKAIPSPSFPNSGNGKYYNGGFITYQYSSINFAQYRINAIQLELPSSFRSPKKKKNIVLNAKSLANVIYTYYFQYGFDQKSS